MPTITVTIDDKHSITISPIGEAGEGKYLDLTQWHEDFDPNAGFRKMKGDAPPKKNVAWSDDHIAWALSQLDQGPKHVCCMKGQNRSPTMAILWLWVNAKVSLSAAREEVEKAYLKEKAPLNKDLISKLLGGIFRGKYEEFKAKNYDRRWG
jgi:hypothetical protein